MPLDVPASADVFIDANILHYAVVPIPPYTANVLPFIDRLRRSEFIAYLNFQALSDAHHKTMASLATSQHQLTPSSIVGWLKNHPQAIKSLTGLAQAATMLNSLPLNLLPTDSDLLTEAAIIAQTHDLLTNDAIIVALMQRHGLTHSPPTTTILIECRALLYGSRDSRLQAGVGESGAGAVGGVITLSLQPPRQHRIDQQLLDVVRQHRQDRESRDCECDGQPHH